MPKYLDLTGLQQFKTKQDEAIAAQYATKASIPTQVSQLENNSNFQTADQVSASISAAVTSAYIFKGSKPTVEELPSTENTVGDVWNVEEDGMNYAWTGTSWDALGGTVDLSGYALVDHTHNDATTEASGFMSTDDKTKLNGIAAGAEVNQNAFANITVGDKTIAADSKSDTLTVAAGTNITIEANEENDTVTITAQDTTYVPATDSADGLMSSADKAKLTGIAAGAEVNQNAFSSIVVGSTTVAADGKTDAFTLEAGANVTITADAAADKITIAATDTTYNEASTTEAGLMSANDKTKLEGIAAGANNYVLPTATDKVLGGVKTGSDVSSTAGLIPVPIISGVPYYADTTYVEATTDAAGLMAANDKTKLDGITTISSSEIDALFA